MSNEPDLGICHGCKKKILSGEPRYTAKEPDEYWHYDCRPKISTSEEVARVSDRVIVALDKLRNVLKRHG